MREKRSRREADVYKAKIGRDAIIDIHVRRYSSKPYYFHPKSTGALVARGFKRGLIYLQEAHRRFAGVSQSVRQTERQKDRKTDISTSQSAQQRRTQPGQDADAKCRLPSTAPQHRTIRKPPTTADLASLYLLPLSHKRRKFNISKRESRLLTRDELGVKYPFYVQDLRFVNRHQHPGKRGPVLWL
jgi:hypothetical protein